MDALRRLGQNRLWDVAALALALAGIWRIAWELPGRATQNDFAHYYTASQMVWDGENPYGRPLRPEYERRGFVYQADVPLVTNLPAMLWMFAPLTLLPVSVAFWFWMVGQWVCLGAILWWTRILLQGQLTARGWWFVCAVTICSAPVYWHFLYSQMQLLLAALVLGGYVCLRRGQPTAACLMVTAAGVIKLFPLAFLPWFLWRGGGSRWARAGRTALALGFAAVVVLSTDIRQWRDFWVQSLPALEQHAVNYSFIYSVPSFLTNLAYAAYGFAPPATLAQAWWRAAVMVGAALLAVGYWLVWRWRGDLHAEFGLLTAALLAGMFKTEGHYFVFLIFPLSMLAVRVAGAPTIGRIVGLGALLLLLNNMGTHAGLFLDRHIYLKILANGTPLFALVAVGWYCASDLRRRRL